MTFAEQLSRLVAQHGQGTLAEKAGTNDSTMSRFRSGEGGLHLDSIEKIISLGGLVLVSRDEIEDLKKALATMAKMWMKEKELNEKLSQGA